MGSRRDEPRGRYERYRGYDSGGWDSGDDRRDRGRERERRADYRRGSSAEEYGRRSVKCYECREIGHYRSQCPRLQGRSGIGGGSGGTVMFSQELENSLSSVGRMARQLLDQQAAAEEAEREAEAKKKKEEEEKAAKEEEAKTALARKLEKEVEEKRRQWEIKKLLVQQREEYEEKLEKPVGLNRKMKGITIGARKKKCNEMPPSTSDEDEVAEEVEEVMPLKDKRKCRDSTGVVESSPPVETPTKMGKLVEAGTPASQKRKGRGTPTKADSQVARLAKGENPWEGVPLADKYATESAYRKVVRRTIASFYPETLKAMCKGAELPFHGVNDAVDILFELRVTYCYRGKKPSGSSSDKPGEEE
ncbi:hypothetical protein CBR_g8788 [Chara braunii]|uniref:CCHC-type domain-containing protein n=1 Tax=Chara braunii TaxID=69332 RepID=A0A388KMT4_CHABU|nr:hypothetical protein CBR_g8788 [Chara braunii]|eukprot:GBG71369.1 hypothetical protein CBR_g8788 [Chara braunii]